MKTGYWLKISFFLLLVLAGCKNSKGTNLQSVDEVQIEPLTVSDEQSEPAYIIHDVGNIPDTDVFSYILSLFPGRPILIDIWATWCNPCRMANEELKPVKAELADKDIVYVFIAGEDSPLRTWKSMLPGLPGEHFRLSEKQRDYISQKLYLNVVPYYLFIDREGTVKEQQAGYPGLEKMREKLLRIVND